MNTVYGLGVCKKCGNPLIGTGQGESVGGVIPCLMCSSKEPCMKPGINVKDPGETAFAEKAFKAALTPHVVKAVSLESVIADLESLPMPKDVKQFKAINKAIGLLKKALENNNGD